ncbi:MAG: ABC transporter substrate-binding protein [Bacteroidota bacterium]
MCILCFAVVLTMGLAGCKPAEVAEDAPAEKEEAPAEVEEEAPAEEEEAEAGPIKLGHANFFTGPYAHIGEQLDQACIHALEFVNANPPIAGREIEYISVDQGQLGEGTTMRQLVDIEQVDLLMNVGMEYLTYRDWLMQHIADNGKPFLPSVHGGSIDTQYGGTLEEPIFRAAPQDADQGQAAAHVAKTRGAETAVVIGIEIDGYQKQKDAAVKACKVLEIEVLEVIDVEPEGTYRAEVAKLQQLDPDAIIIFGDSTDGGIIVKAAAELGMSKMFFGPSDWNLPDFPTTATLEAMGQHELVEVVGFTYAESPAWDFYEESWNNCEECYQYNDASLALTQEFYDSINLSALAIKKAQSTKVVDLVPAYRAVAMGPGKKVYTYKEGFDALEAGEEIDYMGVTGDMDYSATGVCSGSWGVFVWNDLVASERIEVIEGKIVLDLGVAIEDVELD